MRRSSILRTTGIALIGIGALAGIGTLVVRDQISRHQRNLFSRRALKRFAALGYLSGMPATVELVRLLRDFTAWEQNSILRRRALQIVGRMEQELATAPVSSSAGLAG